MVFPHLDIVAKRPENFKVGKYPWVRLVARLLDYGVGESV